MIPESVVVTGEIQNVLKDFLSESNYQKIAVIVDENTEKHCLPVIIESLPDHWLLPISSGEENKTLDTCSLLWRALTEAE